MWLLTKVACKSDFILSRSFTHLDQQFNKIKKARKTSIVVKSVGHMKTLIW